MRRVYLESHRLVLRYFEDVEEDAQRLYHLDLDPEVRRYVHEPEPDRERIRNVVLPRLAGCADRDDGYGLWAAEEMASGRFLGWFHLRPGEATPSEIELGYRLRRESWGRGLATEGAAALVVQGFERLGSARIVAFALPTNAASIRVMEKVGLRFECNTLLPTGEETVKYSMSRDDYVRRRQGGNAL